VATRHVCTSIQPLADIDSRRDLVHQCFGPAPKTCSQASRVRYPPSTPPKVASSLDSASHAVKRAQVYIERIVVLIVFSCGGGGGSKQKVDQRLNISSQRIQLSGGDMAAGYMQPNSCETSASQSSMQARSALDGRIRIKPSSAYIYFGGLNFFSLPHESVGGWLSGMAIKEGYTVECGKRLG
jgi:hypothetical protein